MSNIGYYRYKTLADSEKTVTLYVNGIAIANKYVVPLQGCDQYIVLKYIDKNGQYRFTSFNNRHRIYDSPSNIGTTNKLIVNIFTSQTGSQIIGIKNNRRYDLTGEFDEEQLEKLIDLYTSPMVYLYIGSNNSDSSNDWIEVTLNISDSIIKRRKGIFGRVDLTVILPESYNISKL